MADLTRWTVKVSKETDIAVRSYLAERGGKKGDLSKFIEHAVLKKVLRATVRDIQERNAGLPSEQDAGSDRRGTRRGALGILARPDLVWRASSERIILDTNISC